MQCYVILSASGYGVPRLIGRDPEVIKIPAREAGVTAVIAQIQADLGSRLRQIKCLGEAPADGETGAIRGVGQRPGIAAAGDPQIERWCQGDARTAHKPRRSRVADHLMGDDVSGPGDALLLKADEVGRVLVGQEAHLVVMTSAVWNDGVFLDLCLEVARRGANWIRWSPNG